MPNQVGDLLEVGSQCVLALAIRARRSLSRDALLLEVLVALTLGVIEKKRQRGQRDRYPQQVEPVPQGLGGALLVRRKRCYGGKTRPLPFASVAENDDHDQADRHGCD